MGSSHDLQTANLTSEHRKMSLYSKCTKMDVRSSGGRDSRAFREDILVWKASSGPE